MSCLVETLDLSEPTWQTPTLLAIQLIVSSQKVWGSFKAEQPALWLYHDMKMMFKDHQLSVSKWYLKPYEHCIENFTSQSQHEKFVRRWSLAHTRAKQKKTQGNLCWCAATTWYWPQPFSKNYRWQNLDHPLWPCVETAVSALENTIIIKNEKSLSKQIQIYGHYVFWCRGHNFVGLFHKETQRWDFYTATYSRSSSMV